MRQRLAFKHIFGRMLAELYNAAGDQVKLSLHLEINARLRNPLQAPLMEVSSMIEVGL